MFAGCEREQEKKNDLFPERMKRMKKNITAILLVFVFVLTLVSVMAGTAEDALSGLEDEDLIRMEEDALRELEPLLQDADLKEAEGKDLEEFSAEYLNQYMMEYYDSHTGFSFLYPNWFEFDEQEGAGATSTDGLATLTVDVVSLDSPITEEELTQSLGNSGYTDVSARGEGCFLAEEKCEDGSVRIQASLMTEGCIYNVMIRYPGEQKEKYDAYIGYLVNSMTAEDTDLG